jgi:hypothetical protein
VFQLVRNQATDKYELHTRGILLGRVAELGSPCDARHPETFPLTEWVDISKRLVPGFTRAGYYDSLAPKQFYDAVLAQAIGIGWYYYFDNSIRDTMRDAEKNPSKYRTGDDARDSGSQSGQSDTEEPGRRFDRMNFQASFGYSAIMWERCHERRLFATNTGYLGLGPLEACVGDAVYACPSANVPFVLREVGDGGVEYSDSKRAHYLIGECYVEERMWDDIKSTRNSPRDLEELILV